ncbi:HD domain-containing phosphohydrolase [Bdellovibrionota bacterium FG-1]
MKAPEWHQRVLLLSRDREMRAKLTPIFGRETELVMTNHPADAVIQLDQKNFNVLIMDEKGLEPEDKFEEREELDRLSYLELSQYASQLNQKLTIILLLNKIHGRDGEFAKKCGATFIADRKTLQANEIPYLIRVLRKRTFRTIFLEDLTLDMTFPVDIYHYLPLSNHYVVYMAAGLPFTTARRDKLLSTHEHHVYVRTENLPPALNALRDARATPRLIYSEEMDVVREHFHDLFIRFFDISTDGRPKNGEGMWNEGLQIIHKLSALIQTFGSPLLCIEVLPYARASTIAHGINSALYALLFGRLCGIPNPEITAVCALFSNIGLATIDQKLLKKSEFKLTSLELKAYATHPAASLQMMQQKRITLFPVVQQAILHHHEKHDGSGFPDGLWGPKIPVEAALLSIVGAFDHFYAKREGDRARKPAEAWAELKKYSAPSGVEIGKFNPDLLVKIGKLFQKT